MKRRLLLIYFFLYLRHDFLIAFEMINIGTDISELSEKSYNQIVPVLI